MLDPPSSKDELKGKGKPEEKTRLGRRMGAMEGASGSGSGREKGSSMSMGGCYLSRSPESVGGGLTPRHTTSWGWMRLRGSGLLSDTNISRAAPSTHHIRGGAKGQTDGQKADDLCLYFQNSHSPDLRSLPSLCAISPNLHNKPMNGCCIHSCFVDGDTGDSNLPRTQG